MGVICLMGCQNGQNPFVPGGGTVTYSTGWPFWPAKMRIHPLTRIVDDEERGGEIIEARVEFTDAHDHMTKAYGYLRVELFNATSLSPAIAGWNIDLRDIAFNATRFDDVSRTYLLRLRVENGPIPEQPLLRVQFHSVNEVDVEAEHRIRR